MSFEEKTEKKVETKSPPSDKPNPDLEACIKEQVEQGMSEEEAKGYCAKQTEKTEKTEEVNVEKKEELPPGEKAPVEEITEDPNAPPKDPNAPPQQDPNAPPQAPQDPNAPQQGQGFGQYTNFEQCLNDQRGQGLNPKDSIVNCAAQLLQHMESQGLAAPVGMPIGMPQNGMGMQRPPYGASYNVAGVEFNTAEFPDFETCVVSFKDKGLGKDEAIAKCKGIFEAKFEKSPTPAEPVQVEKASDDKLYIRAFLLDTSLNKNFWGVNNASIDQRINSFIGRPLVLTEDFGHPELSDMAFGHALQYQDVYRIGTIIDVVQTAKSEHDKAKKVYYAIIELTEPKAKEAFKNNKLPLYVSPAVAKMNAAEADGQINEWLGMHLALVDKPAFGVQKAMITGTCSGEQDKCVMHLRQAKIEKHGYGNCGFCVYGKLTSVLTAKTEVDKPQIIEVDPKTNKTTDSSLTSEITQKQLTMSQKTEENVEANIAEAKEEIKKAEAEKAKSPKADYKDLDLFDAKLVRYETENTLLKANVDNLRKEVDRLSSENDELKTSIRRAEIANIVTAEVYPDEIQRKKMIDLFTDKKLSATMVAEMYESMKGSVKVAKSSGYDARVPLVKTAKASNNLDEGVSLAKEVKNIFIKGGNA